MALYESTVIVRQDQSRQDVAKLTEQMTDIIQTAGGRVLRNEYWGLRNLAYKINKSRRGHYAHMGFDAPFAAIKEMQRTLGIREEVIRTLTVRVDALSDEPTAMMNQKSGRDEEAATDDVLADI